jgi:hypothetical protein
VFSPNYVASFSGLEKKNQYDTGGGVGDIVEHNYKKAVATRSSVYRITTTSRELENSF